MRSFRQPGKGEGPYLGLLWKVSTGRELAVKVKKKGFQNCQWRENYRSSSALWTRWMAMEPSPTADATRFTLLERTSPTANTPGRLVSIMSGRRLSGHADGGVTPVEAS